MKYTFCTRIYIYCTKIASENKMADDSVVLCDALCFIVNKYGKVHETTLKSVLTDFYDVDCLSKAKLRLIEDIDKLNLSTKRPHVASRRDGDGRLAKEVGDILSLLQFVDEHNLSSNLPTYVASSPDTMPSLRLYDGDMKMIVKMLQDMRANLFEYGSAIAAICTEVKGLQQVVKDLSHADRQPRPRPAVSKTGDVTQLGAVGVARQSAGEMSAAMPIATESESETVRTTSVRDWAAAASTPRPHGSRYSVLSIDDDDDDQDDANQGFVTVDRRRRKRMRQHTTPQENTLRQSQNPRSSQSQTQQRQQPSTEQQDKRRTTLVGKAAVVSNIKAAKKIRRKAVFCIDNVDESCSVSDICYFAKSLGVEAQTCFEVKPRLTRRGAVQPTSCNWKAFRLCIYEEDRARLLKAGSWPDSIKVSDWYFKPQNSTSDNRRPAAAAAVVDDTAERVTGQASGLQGDGVSAATTASTAPTVSASSRDPTSSDDETIIQADSRVDNGIDN